MVGFACFSTISGDQIEFVWSRLIFLLSITNYFDWIVEKNSKICRHPRVRKQTHQCVSVQSLTCCCLPPPASYSTARSAGFRDHQSYIIIGITLATNIHFQCSELGSTAKSAEDEAIKRTLEKKSRRRRFCELLMRMIRTTTTKRQQTATVAPSLAGFACLAATVLLLASSPVQCESEDARSSKKSLRGLQTTSSVRNPAGNE
jgi:hypothetical protein